MKKKRKLERAAEREEEKKEEEVRVARAALEAAAGIVADAAAEGVEVVVEEGKGKRKREERERKKGTIPYGLGQKILLVGEGKLLTPLSEINLERTNVVISFSRKLLLRPFLTSHLTSYCYSSSPPCHFFRYSRGRCPEIPRSDAACRRYQGERSQGCIRC